MDGYLKIMETTVRDQDSAVNRAAIPNKVSAHMKKNGLKQIRNKQYQTEKMKTNGIKTFIKIGLAFYKKQVRIKYEAEG